MGSEEFTNLPVTTELIQLFTSLRTLGYNYPTRYKPVTFTSKPPFMSLTPFLPTILHIFTIFHLTLSILQVNLV